MAANSFCGSPHCTGQWKFCIPSVFQSPPFDTLDERKAEHAHQLLMQIRMVWRIRGKIHKIAEEKGEGDILQGLGKLQSVAEGLKNLSGIECNCLDQETLQILLSSLSDVIPRLVSWFNRTSRLFVDITKDPKDFSPVGELAQIEKTKYCEGLLPPPTPCEYVEEEYVWFRWGEFCKSSEFIGHGWFWRPQPPESTEELTNMATNAMTDFDLMEDSFVHLSNASVIVADHDLIRHDFPELSNQSDEEIDQWLIQNGAFLSAGQVNRISPGGDHHSLLGVDQKKGMSEVVDTEKKQMGIRLRSGGRAASFPIGGNYSIDEDGFLQAKWLEVKGLGTHKRAAFGENPRNTGLLNLADALREFAVQRLIQRLLEIKGKSSEMSCVKFYAILDTGLAYGPEQINPSTGWTGEMCVLAIRQRQSRAFVHYEGYNFSGNLLMSGEPYPSRTMLSKNFYDFRQLLTEFGISCEITPLALFAESEEERLNPKALDDLQGMWNIQADAALSHLMDFSDYYVLPYSNLEHWRMGLGVVRDSLTLERSSVHEMLFKSKRLLETVYGTSDPEKAKEIQKKQLADFSKNKKFLEACSNVTKDEEPQVIPGKPKFCMCWFMELDDSEMSQWALAGGNGIRGKALLNLIEEWLPKKG